MASVQISTLKVSHTDPHRPDTYISSTALSAAIGRKTYVPHLPLHSQSQVKHNVNSNVDTKRIHVLPKELFEVLVESKVDPDVLSDSQGKVCQTLCSDGVPPQPSHSHNTNIQLNNSQSPGLDNKVFPRSSLITKGLQNEEKSSKSSIFTVVGRQLVNSNNTSVIKCPKESKDSLSKCSGTYFSVLASPKAINRHQVNQLNHQNYQTNQQNSILNLNNGFQYMSENDKSFKDFKVTASNETLNFKLSLPQEVSIQSIREFCRVMSEDETIEKLEANDNVLSETNVLSEQIKQLPALKSPIIVKEVMKKIASLPSGGFRDNVDIEVTECEAMNCHINAHNHINHIIQINGQNCSVNSDTEAMLVIQELDRSIAEASPSNANSPVILPRLHDNNQNDSQNTKSDIKMKNSLRPNKPPRLHNYSSIETKRQNLIESNETQTDNLIEELYLNDDNGSKTNKTIKNIRINDNKTETIVINKHNLDSHKNVIDLKYNYNTKSINMETSNELDGAITRTSVSSVDSGTSSPNSSHFIVVAIDFGTTFSGYSFAFTRDIDNAIHMMRKVEGCDPDVSNQKIPTILLLNEDGAFNSFGFAARDHFSSLEPKEANKWFYFEKFKMDLHYNQSLSLDTKIKATNSNKCMSALTVFGHALRYFKLLALRELSDQSAITILNEDIRWVITVPALWKPSAKQFMRAAAYEAGIGSADNSSQLLIALEPEAASIYCRRLKFNQLIPVCSPQRHPSHHDNNTNDNHIAVDCKTDILDSINPVKCSLNNDCVDTAFTKGIKYLVVDVGGGTVDITCHQIQNKKGSLKELHKSMGGPNGSVGVDLNFEKLLSDIFGADFITQFKCKRPAGYVDLMAAFEARKRSASPSQTTTSNISLPFSFINFFKKFKGMTVENAVKKYTESKGITYCCKLGMLRLEPLVMQRLFVSVAKQIISHICDILNNQLCKDVTYLFLVGGFSESQILQSHMRSAFSSRIKLIIPQSPNLAILRGAVMYGLDPTVISCRRAKLTYGVGVLNRFIRGKHPPHKLAIKDDIEWCADVFDRFVICDQSIGLYESITRSYTPVNERQSCSIIHIYCSDRDDVEYITDPDVHRCGTLFLDLDLIPESNHINPALKAIIKREIQTQMIFGDTEIKVTALDVLTGKCVKAEVDFLSN